MRPRRSTYTWCGTTKRLVGSANRARRSRRPRWAMRSSQPRGSVSASCPFRRDFEKRQREKGSHMKNAKELLEEFTAASFRDPKKAAEMFSEDGAFEMPYLESFGFPGRYEGREAIEGFLDLENIKVMIDTPEQAFAEYGFTAQSSKTGRT